MIHSELQYSTVSRIILLMLGLSYYSRSKLISFQSILFSGILWSFIGFQFTTFITSECTPDLITKVFSSTSILISITLGYNAYWINIGTMKSLLEQLQHIYNELKDQNEIDIMGKYGKKGKLYTNRLTIFGACILSSVVILQFRPSSVNIASSVSKSRLHGLPLLTEYFFDREKYYYLIWLHMNIASCIAVFAGLAIIVTMKEYYQYVCGLFKIASYRIEHAMKIDTKRNIDLGIENIVNTHLINAIDIHRKAMKCSDILLSPFEVLAFIVIVIDVISMSLNLFRIFLSSSENNVEELLMHFGFVFGCFVYMFLINHIGQEMTDHNNHIFITAYNTQWYKASLPIQKMILYLLQRGNKVYVLTIGGLFVGSLESFTKLTSTSLSYFTILFSVCR